MAQRLFLFLFLLFITSNALNLTSLKSFCDSTPYPHSCFSSLRLSIGVDPNPNILSHLRATLATAISESDKLSDLLSAAGRNLNIVERHRGTLQDCRELHEVTVSALRRSVARVNAGGSRQLADAGAYLSAALTNQDTCLEGLDSASGPMKPAVVRSVVRIHEHVGNSLSILSRIGAPAGRRMTGFPAKRARRILDDYHGRRKGLTITVNQDGTGNFSTISDAVRFAPSNSDDQIVIYVKDGFYKENVEIPRHKTNIVLIGDGSDVTVVTGLRSVAGGWTAFRSATVAVSGDGFLARDVTFENAAESEGQAVALRINADLAALYRCSITGYQNTLYAHSFRQFYRECEIYGSIDYIFGDAAAIFQASKTISHLPVAGGYTVVTAQSRASPYASTGFSFQNCSILADRDLDLDLNRTVRNYLRRPPRAYSRTVVLKSYIEAFIDQGGWMEYSGSDGLETLYYGEYENYGHGSDTDHRVDWGGYHVMDYNEAYNFTVSNFIAGDEWLNSTDFHIPYDDWQINCYLAL